MLLAIDVYYNEQSAKVVGALFSWEDKEPQKIITCTYPNVLPYESGMFYKRELPCILELLKKVKLNKLTAIIVDGHCFVNNDKKNGLGGYLWESLGKKVPIIGIAKRSFNNTEKVSREVYRGESTNPLYVSVIDFDLDEAIANIKEMHGEYRMPTILKQVDSETRGI
ncbi:endonuclease V [Tenacibaculum aiptasiae]|uniref:Endonuclease V n=1 Tax=Tenacibaculum aiptasiae TaxID=426481 RepID=A0A7J5AS25_9FLAO|nr:endonuclease V [Tenacibaculum aiptasiae]KAB1160344.1 endonuclease V [Tenacibaculum aiptasiae]